MAGDDEVIHQSSDFGRIATHPTRDVQPLLVAPTTDALFNTLGLDLIPVACMSLHDILFAFDSSFVTQSVTAMLKELPGLRESHKNSKGELPRLSIFGHADPVGDDELNKQLSGRRATAIYGVLTQSVPIWRKLLNHPSSFGDDNWRTQNVTARMRAVVGSGHNSDDDLIKAYLAAICPFQLQNGDFLGDGGDPGGKADYQGCSSFNAQVILSEEQNKKETKENRNTLNQPNRRVVIYLFRAGTKVNPSMWPCPTATEPTQKCRARFFGPPSTGDYRRKPDTVLERLHLAGPTVDADAFEDTFACRFYSRISNLSPCEGKIVPALRVIHVYLKLQYKDPEDPAKPHDFPADVPVIVDDGGGTLLTVKTTAGGLVDFEFDRDRHQFTLRFEMGDGHYFANATADTKGPGPERLLTESDVADAVEDHYRFFKVPPKWSLAETDWAVGSSSFWKGFFIRLDADGADVGSLGSPVGMVLDPHWHYIRFAYFDRALKKKLSILPITLDGFRKAAGSGSPDTRSNWTVKPDALVQCLPWILQAPPKPDKDTLIQFQTGDNTFIEAKVDDGSRKIAAGAKHDKPEADRLRFYDLPKLWKSSHYFARFSSASGVAVGTDGPYEKVADKPTSIDKPMIFSLDDMVLTDAGIHPIAWTAKDRVAIFKNTFSGGEGDYVDMDVSDIGLFQPSVGENESYLTIQPLVDTGGNYIAEYPDWTRLLIVKANLFDVFDRRTTTGQVIGARAAVRWVETASRGPAGTDHPVSKVETGGSFFTIQAYFEQYHTEDDSDRIGRFDITLLRCCDKDDDTEVAVSFNYFPYHFNFQPPPDKNFPSQPLEKPLTTDKVEQQKFADAAVNGFVARWNGTAEVHGPFGPGRPQLFPDEDDPTAKGDAPDLRVPLVFFSQSLPKGLAHVSWGIYKEVRANAGSPTGLVSLKVGEQVPALAPPGKKSGSYVLAHESGHIYGLNDEYVENSIYASAFKPGIVNYEPGGPYARSPGDMMCNNFFVSPRYYWHSAEWLHSLKSINFPFLVEQGPFEYRIPHHPDMPRRSFVSLPLVEKKECTSAGRGKFDLFFYPLGDEPYSSEFLPRQAKEFPGGLAAPKEFDAMLVIIVKFKVHVFKDGDNFVDDACDSLNASIQNSFLHRWNLKGSVKRKFFTGDGTFTFENAYLNFRPRFLVVNPPQETELKTLTGFTTLEAYKQKLRDLEADPGVHFDLTTEEHGASRWAVKPEPAAAGKAAPRGHLILSHEDTKDTLAFDAKFREFFWNMLGFPDADPAAGAAQLQKLARLVIPDAIVTKFDDVPKT